MSSLLTLSSTCFLSPPTKFSAITSVLGAPKYLKNPRIIVPKFPNNGQKQQIIEELNKVTYNLPITTTTTTTTTTKDIATVKMYAILEVISDRIEMHQNIGQQRENWNSLLLHSVNMITLTAATMAGLSDASGPHEVVGLKVSSTLLFLAATGILTIMNKIQPSQLVEEQRNAVRLFKKLQASIQTTLSLRTPAQKDVDKAIDEVLALDRAFPLPLLGAMLEKFPSSFEPAKWWSSKKQSTEKLTVSKNKFYSVNNSGENGWSQELEEDMKEIVRVTKSKDIEDYVRLGNKALKLNKMLAILGPLLTGIAGIGSGLMGHGGPWAGLVAAIAGSMAVVVNTIEHGGQVGMVFEMYRNCGGFFRLLEEIVESTLEEEDLGERENGEVFEMKMALYLGRSLSELREFAEKSRRNGGIVNEFASKLF